MNFSQNFVPEDGPDREEELAGRQQRHHHEQQRNARRAPCQQQYDYRWHLEKTLEKNATQMERMRPRRQRARGVRLTRRRRAGPSRAAGRASSTSALGGRRRRRRLEEGLAQRPGREQQQRQRRAAGRSIPRVILLRSPRHTESASHTDLLWGHGAESQSGWRGIFWHILAIFDGYFGNI